MLALGFALVIQHAKSFKFTVNDEVSGCYVWK